MRRTNHLAFASLLLLAGACAGEVTETEPLTFEEFQQQAYHEEDTGFYIVNGDEPARDLADLREMYDSYLESVDQSGIGSSKHESIVHVSKGQWAKWSSSQAQNLTYCISQSSFGSRYNTVVQAMASAASAWEGAGRINFVHASSQDGNCTARNKNVVFNVRQVCTGQYLASAFFPNYSRGKREVKIDCTSFGNISPWSLAGVLRHELGHSIGLRHEHTRPESGACFEDNNWAALTAYDSESVMHYPQCNGTQDGDLVLTNLDRTGASILYP